MRAKQAQRTAIGAMLLCLALGYGSVAWAQGKGGGMGGPMGGSMGGGMGPGQGSRSPFGGGFPDSAGRPGDVDGRMSPPSPRSGSGGTISSMRGGLQLGPPGRWWDDKDFAKTLGLRKDQQQRMDASFNANKGAILESYKSLQKEESRLENITRAHKLDEASIFAAIDSVTQARGALEKANAHMLLQIRQEMDPDQVARMEKFRDRPADQ